MTFWFYYLIAPVFGLGIPNIEIWQKINQGHLISNNQTFYENIGEKPNADVKIKSFECF